MIPITVRGDTYTSVAAAWRELSPEGLLLNTVRWRLKHGWLPEEAILVPMVPPAERRTFKELRVSS